MLSRLEKVMSACPKPMEMSRLPPRSAGYLVGRDSRVSVTCICLRNSRVIEHKAIDGPESGEQRQVATQGLRVNDYSFASSSSWCLFRVLFVCV